MAKKVLKKAQAGAVVKSTKPSNNVNAKLNQAVKDSANAEDEMRYYMRQPKGMAPQGIEKRYKQLDKIKEIPSQIRTIKKTGGVVKSKSKSKK